MGTDIAMMAAGYLAVRIALLAAAGYMIYRVLRNKPTPVRIRTQSSYAAERRRSSRSGR